jgi:hypothetical protein
MTPCTRPSPVQQATQALQVAGVLARMEHRFEGGAWARGARFAEGGGTCLVGAIDEATRWTLPGVAEEVAERLASHLPRPLRALGRSRPRLALALYNDSIGGHAGALALVRATRRDLFGSFGSAGTSTPRSLGATTPRSSVRAA